MVSYKFMINIAEYMAKPVGNSRVFRRAQRKINDNTNHEHSMDSAELGAVGSSSYARVSTGTRLPQQGTFIFHMFSTLPSWAQTLLLASASISHSN